MEITPEITLALIGIMGTVINFWYTRNRVAAEARTIEADAAHKLSETAAGLAGEIQTHIVDELKTQLQKYADRIDRLELLTTHQEELLTTQGKRISEQDAVIREQGATIKEQGGVIMQLRQRVSDLENENGHLRRENDQLKQRGGKL